MRVVLGRLVERRGDHLALYRASHVGHLFWSLADEADHQRDLWIVRGDTLRNLLQETRLPRLWRRDDQRALPLTERVDEVDQALRKIRWIGLKVDQLNRMDWSQITEVWSSACRLWVGARDDLNAEHPPELLSFARCANHATNRISLSQADAAQHRRRNVDIVSAW